MCSIKINPLVFLRSTTCQAQCAEGRTNLFSTPFPKSLTLDLFCNCESLFGGVFLKCFLSAPYCLLLQDTASPICLQASVFRTKGQTYDRHHDMHKRWSKNIEGLTRRQTFTVTLPVDFSSIYRYVLNFR
jgi:hypothetical protein